MNDRATADLLSDVIGARGPDGASLCAELATRGLRELARCGDLGRRIGPRRAARVQAALELGARLASEWEVGEVVESPGETARHLLPRYAAEPVEKFGVLLLNARHRIIREAIISVGCLTASLVHPRELFGLAVEVRAAALVLFHNHPSGDAEPSAEDIALTRRLCAAGSLLGIEVLDHLIIGAGRWVSLKDRGML